MTSERETQIDIQTSVTRYFNAIGEGELLTKDEQLVLGRQISDLHAAEILSEIIVESETEGIPWQDKTAEYLDDLKVAWDSTKKKHKAKFYLKTAADICDFIQDTNLLDLDAKDMKGMLLISIQRGERARQELAFKNTRFVVSVAKEFREKGIDFADLIQEGNIGLMKAVDKFDWRLNNSFSTMATHWIRQSITRALPRSGRDIRMDQERADLARHITKKRAEFEMTVGDSTINDKFLQFFLDDENSRRHLQNASVGATVKELQEVLQEDYITTHVDSLTRPLHSETEDTVEDHLPDLGTSVSDSVDTNLQEQSLYRLIGLLPEEYSRVLVLRFGLNGSNPHTLNETAVLLNKKNIQEVRRLETKALEQLKFLHFQTSKQI